MKLPTLDEFLENLYHNIRPMFTQFDDDPLISERVQEMLTNDEGKLIIRDLCNQDRSGELSYMYKGEKIEFYK